VTSKVLGIDDLVKFAMQVIRLAGKEALSYYGKGKAHLRFDEGLVTEAELRLTEFFENQLHAKFPGHQIFNHKQQSKDYTHEGARHLWVFDALDGVANFQAGIPLWGSSLALLENFWPIFGVFHMPVTNDIFHARAGDKAYWGDQEIRAAAQTEGSDEGLLLTYSRFHNHYSSTFPGKIRNMGCTAAHVSYVATGRAEGAIIANASFQDLAAVRVIIEAAGAKIYKMDGGEFFLNEYLDGQRIDDHLLVVAPDIASSIRSHLNKKQ
jgi:myo-inositol-1(or 4)-monophosphatase